MPNPQRWLLGQRPCHQAWGGDGGLVEATRQQRGVQLRATPLLRRLVTFYATCAQFPSKNIPFAPDSGPHVLAHVVTACTSLSDGRPAIKLPVTCLLVLFGVLLTHLC